MEKQQYGLKRSPEKYSNRESAFRSLKHYSKPCFTVVLGTDLKYWVVSFSDAQKLQKFGFELAI